MINIYFIRHSETEENKKRRIQGRSDFPLSFDGRVMCEIAGKKLKELNLIFNSCYTSPLSRAYDSAKLTLSYTQSNLKIVSDDALLEREFGEADGLTISEEIFRKINEGLYKGQETNDDVRERVSRFIDRILDKSKDGDNIVIFSHSHTIKAYLSSINKDIIVTGPLTNLSLCKVIVNGKDKDVVLYNKSLINGKDFI